MHKREFVGRRAGITAAFLPLALLFFPASAAGPPAPVKVQPEEHWPVDIGGHALTFSPDSKTLALACRDKSVVLLSVASGKELQRLRNHYHRVFAFSYARDGERLLASTFFEGAIVTKVWNPMTGKELARYELRDAGGLTTISPDGKWLVMVTPDATTVAHLWDIESGKEVATLDAGQAMDYVMCAGFSRDGKVIALGGGKSDGHVVFFDGATFRKTKSIQSAQPGPVSWISLSAKGDLMVCGRGKIEVWDVSAGKRLHPYLGATGSAALSPDGSLLAFGVYKGMALCSVAPFRRLALLEHGDFSIGIPEMVAFSPDGRFVARAGQSGTCLWRVPQMENQQAAPKEAE